MVSLYHYTSPLHVFSFSLSSILACSVQGFEMERASGSCPVLQKATVLSFVSKAVKQNDSKNSFKNSIRKPQQGSASWIKRWIEHRFQIKKMKDLTKASVYRYPIQNLFWNIPQLFSFEFCDIFQSHFFLQDCDCLEMSNFILNFFVFLPKFYFSFLPVFLVSFQSFISFFFQNLYFRFLPKFLASF